MNKKKELMEYFMEEPNRQYHVRELSKLAGKSPTTISKNLKTAVKEGLLASEKRLNHLLFKANLNSQNYKIMKIKHNLLMLEKSGIIEYLEEFYEKPSAIVLFGSCASGEDIESSDIDLLIVSSLKKEIPAETREKFEKIMSKEIQIFKHSQDEIKKMNKEEKALLNSFANGIVLRGFLEVIK